MWVCHSPCKVVDQQNAVRNPFLSLASTSVFLFVLLLFLFIHLSIYFSLFVYLLVEMNVLILFSIINIWIYFDIYVCLFPPTVDRPQAEAHARH